MADGESGEESSEYESFEDEVVEGFPAADDIKL